MNATTAASAPPLTNTGETPVRRAKKSSARFPLVLKLFLLTALLIVIVIGMAIGITLQRSSTIAKGTVDQAIASAASLFEKLEKNRLKELSLGVETLAHDPSFAAYVQDAIRPAAPEEVAVPNQLPSTGAAEPAAVDTASILDQLAERQTILGSDLLMLTDDQGMLLARTDQQNITATKPEDLYQTQPLLKTLIDSGGHEPVTGVIVTGGKLYHAAMAPLSVGANQVPTGFLVTAYAIDERFANQIADATKAAVLFFPNANGKAAGGAIRSANAPNAESIRSMNEVAQISSGATMISPHSVKIDNSNYVMTGEPLRANKRPMGTAIFVRSLEAELAPFREIERTLLIAGGTALLLAFALSWLIARRLTRPIENLATMAQSVADGDLSVQPEIRRNDEVGLLARSFGQMISSLRDKAELEELYHQMSAREEESARTQTVTIAPTRREGTILVTDLRGINNGEGDATDVIARISGAMKIQAAEIARQDGEVLQIEGHRLITRFDGDHAVLHAVRAARAINEELGLRTSTSPQPLSVGIGIATGDYVTGSVAVGDDSGMAIVGNAPLLALLFAWEAPAGWAYISLETAQTAGADIANIATRDEVRLKWLPAPLPVAALPLQTLSTGTMRSLNTGGSEAATMKLGGTPVIPIRSDLSTGSLFANRYQIESILGRGGMGVVYKATDRQLDETVAIKTLPQDAMSRSSEEVERFKREIRLARRITHRNVLRTYDYGEAEGAYFISMEYVRGYTLSELLAESPKMAPRIAVGIARQICRGLQAAHDEGIIHRDIKPQNVLIDSKGVVKLMDFGIARVAEAKEAMTATGLIVGTPHYMSPEQVQGHQLDSRSDVYSMGVMLYEMLCGSRPFDSPSLTAILTAHITQPPKPPIEVRPDLGRDLNRIILRCLAKEPVERYANAGELLTDLDTLQNVSVAA